MFEFILYKNEDDLFLENIDFSSLLAEAKIKKAEGCYYFFDYDDVRVNKMVWSLKFRGQRKFAEFFGASLYENLGQIDEIKGNFDERFLLIPIPVHKKRRVERGFNQCEWICESLIKNFEFERNSVSVSALTSSLASAEINLDYQQNYLIREKYTKKQSWKKARDREKDLKDVFVVPEKFQQQIRGRKIILVDDVVTTGSTIREARRTLLESGASLVIAIAIAH